MPKPSAAVVWGKIMICIDKKDFLMLHVEYYDEDGTLINTMTGSDVKMLGGKLLPARLEMVTSEKKGNKTVMIYNELVFDKPIGDDFFTTQNMAKVQ
jgi:outer membrane lipoprotein-sorting protein